MATVAHDALSLVIFGMLFLWGVFSFQPFSGYMDMGGCRGWKSQFFRFAFAP